MTEQASTRLEIVWVQNLKGLLEGKFPADEGWIAIFIRELDAISDRDVEICRLRQENDRLKTAGVCELAASNLNVDSYMKEWEDRALKAEVLLTSEREAREKAEAERDQSNRRWAEVCADFIALQKAIVGDSGLSAILRVEQLKAAEADLRIAQGNTDAAITDYNDALARLKDAEAERDDLLNEVQSFRSSFKEQVAAKARLKEAEAVIAPFGKLGSQFSVVSSARPNDCQIWGFRDENLTYGDFRAAAKYMEAKDGNQ